MQLREKLHEWEAELRSLLPGLPEKIEIEFDNTQLIPSDGTGGFALERDKILLAFDPNFSGDKDQQMCNFKASLFHEGFHLLQGFVGNDEDIKHVSALENAVYEGAATMFEMLRAGSNPPWGAYPEDVQNWVDELARLDNETYWKAWRQWKFYDPETDRRYIMYRSGTYIVEQALKNSGKSIEELAVLGPMDIFELSGLSK